MLNTSVCGPCNESCICDGYGFPWRMEREECTPIYGDGLIRLEEECDDNNTLDGDGCSSSSTVEPFYICYFEPSECILSLNITF